MNISTGSITDTITILSSLKKIISKIFPKLLLPTFTLEKYKLTLLKPNSRGVPTYECLILDKPEYLKFEFTLFIENIHNIYATLNNPSFSIKTNDDVLLFEKVKIKMENWHLQELEFIDINRNDDFLRLDLEAMSNKPEKILFCNNAKIILKFRIGKNIVSKSIGIINHYIFENTKHTLYNTAIT